MDYLAANVLTVANIAALTNQYKYAQLIIEYLRLLIVFRTIIRPILKSQPDVTHLAWGATIGDWNSAMDLMAHILFHKPLLLFCCSLLFYPFSCSSSLFPTPHTIYLHIFLTTKIIPAGQYNLFLNTTAPNPMPFNMYTNLTDGTSIFFYWEQSFVLYNKVCIHPYHLLLSYLFSLL